MDDISSAQVCEIIKQITDEGIKSYIFKVGNYNDHCFVTLKSDEKYVIRISRKGWTQNDRKIEKFMRERIAGELIGERAKISTPRTLFIDGSLRSCFKTIVSEERS